MSPGERSLLIGVLDSIDHADPTNSREVKPSERMRNQRSEKTFLRTFIVSVVNVLGVIIGIGIIRGYFT